MSALIDTAVDDARRVATELRPVIHDDLGIVAAMKDYIGDINRRGPIHCVLTTNRREIEIADDRATALFHAVAEA